MNAPPSAAWAWVLSNYTTIERISSRFARSHRLDLDDLRQSIVLRLVERHDRYDPAISSASTWTWWTAREVSTSLVRGSFRLVASGADLEERPVDDEGFERVERASTVRAILARCSPAQRDAVTSVLDDLSRDEIVDRLGVSPETRNARLYRIGRYVDADAGGAA